MVINLGMQRLGYPLKLGIGTSGITGLVSGEIHTCRLTFSLQNRALLIFTVVIMIFIQFEETKNDAWYPTTSQLPTTTVCRLVSPVGFYGPPYNSGGHRWWQCGKSTNPSTSKSSGQWSGAGKILGNFTKCPKSSLWVTVIWVTSTCFHSLVLISILLQYLKTPDASRDHSSINHLQPLALNICKTPLIISETSPLPWQDLSPHWATISNREKNTPLNRAVRLLMLHQQGISPYNLCMGKLRMVNSLELYPSQYVTEPRMFHFPEIGHIPFNGEQRWTICDICCRHPNFVGILAICSPVLMVKHPVCDCFTV